MFPRLAVLRKFCQLGAIEKHHKFISISKRERERETSSSDSQTTTSTTTMVRNDRSSAMITTTTRTTTANKYIVEQSTFLVVDRRKIPGIMCVVLLIRETTDFLSLSLSLCTNQTDLQLRHFFRLRSSSVGFIYLFVYLFFPQVRASVVVIQFVTQTEVLITSFRLICTFRGEQRQTTG